VILPSRRIKRTRGGRFQVRLPEAERRLLATLPGQVAELLSGDHPDARRLFPPAYGGDHPEREAEYQHYMRDDLLESHRRSLDVMAATVDATELDGDQMTAWMAAINQMRLVIGTRLDISEEMAAEPFDEDDPDAPLLSLYHYLSWLQEQVVEALAG
jgi:hypothetical protein